ncbi:hypothetical protein H4P35_21645 [Achromobacter sp. 77]|uniref:hypothetical protein n=1 Tax=Achromobacter TaxID=222 RepID=UPI001D0167F3|nr:MULTISPECIES: hypothetical protein [Achromobacter]MCU6616226.1 hypothetical protein [Achromobacter mucicolens]UDG74783.1 hypothetical protein H4P35_21645 [Achromobacter sp. 77]
MSGFLRQLASRSLGTAPRLRSAPSPLAAALHGVVPRDPLRADAQDQDGHLAGHDSAAQAGRGLADTGNRLGQRFSQGAAFGAYPHADEAADVHARASGREAAMPQGHFIANAPVTHAGMRTSGAPQRTDAAPPPLRSPLLPDPGDQDSISLEAQRPVSASVAPPADAVSATPVVAAQAVTNAAHASNAHASAAPNAAAAQSPPFPAARRDAASPASRPAAQSSAPDVHITIDRLEVAPPPPPRAAAAPRSSALSLRDYLAARRAGLP